MEKVIEVHMIVERQDGQEVTAEDMSVLSDELVDLAEKLGLLIGASMFITDEE
jgi:hypothetical protein